MRDSRRARRSQRRKSARQSLWAFDGYRGVRRLRVSGQRQWTGYPDFRSLEDFGSLTAWGPGPRAGIHMPKLGRAVPTGGQEALAIGRKNRRTKLNPVRVPRSNGAAAPQV